jgi:hypothetical protein
MEIHVVDVNIQVEESKGRVTFKLIPLAIPQIKIGVQVTLIDIITHAYEVFKTPYTILKDTLVTKRPRLDFVSLVKPAKTIGQQHVDDLVARVEHALGDSFQRRNLVLNGW